MKVFVRLLGYVLVRQPAVILSGAVKKMNAWICAPPTTDNDPASVPR